MSEIVSIFSLPAPTGSGSTYTYIAIYSLTELAPDTQISFISDDYTDSRATFTIRDCALCEISGRVCYVYPTTIHHSYSSNACRIESNSLVDCKFSYTRLTENGASRHVSILDVIEISTEAPNLPVETVSDKARIVHLDLCNIQNSLIRKGQNTTCNVPSCVSSIENIDSIVTYDYTQGTPVFLDSEGILRLIYPETASSVIKMNCPAVIDTTTLSGAYKNALDITSVDLSNLEKITAKSGLSQTFYGCTNLQSINLQNLRFVSQMALHTAFYNCTSLKNISFPNLVEDRGAFSDAFYKATSLVSASFPQLRYMVGSDSNNYYAYETFRGCTSLTNIYFPKLAVFKGDGTFYECTKLERVSFPNLEYIIKGRNLFCNCSKLKEVYLPKLKYVGESGLNSAFQSTTLESISFDSLEKVSEYAFSGTFASCSKLRNVYFPKLKAEGFEGCTTVFSGMLNGISNCTVHFPAHLQKTIMQLPEYVLNFSNNSAYNNSIVFDLDACDTTINAGEDTIIYVDGILVANNHIKLAKDSDQELSIVKDNRILQYTVHIPNNDTYTINVDMESFTYETITFNANVEDFKVSLSIKDIFISRQVSGNTVQFQIHSEPINISYSVNKKRYLPITGELTLSGSNQTINLTLEESNQIVTYTLDGIGDYGWREATVTNPKEIEGWTMLESANSNIGAHSKRAVMKVTFSGFDSFTLYINSYAESSCDYTCVSYLDAPSYATSYSDSNIYKDGSGSNNASTAGKQYTPTVFNTTNWKTVTFNNIDGREHYFYVSYIKDGSVDRYNDAGYILIDENQ